MWTLCVICGKEGLKEMGEDGEIRSILEEVGITWECKTLMENGCKGMEKGVRIWNVILMENG